MSTNSTHHFFFHVHRGIHVPVEPVKGTGNGYNLTVNLNFTSNNSNQVVAMPFCSLDTVLRNRKWT